MFGKSASYNISSSRSASPFLGSHPSPEDGSQSDAVEQVEDLYDATSEAFHPIKRASRGSFGSAAGHGEFPRIVHVEHSESCTMMLNNLPPPPPPFPPPHSTDPDVISTVEFHMKESVEGDYDLSDDALRSMTTATSIAPITPSGGGQDGDQELCEITSHAIALDTGASARPDDDGGCDGDYDLSDDAKRCIITSSQHRLVATNTEDSELPDDGAFTGGDCDLSDGKKLRVLISTNTNTSMLFDEATCAGGDYDLSDEAKLSISTASLQPLDKGKKKGSKIPPPLPGEEMSNTSQMGRPPSYNEASQFTGPPPMPTSCPPPMPTSCPPPFPTKPHPAMSPSPPLVKAPLSPPAPSLPPPRLPNRNPSPSLTRSSADENQPMVLPNQDTQLTPVRQKASVPMKPTVITKRVHIAPICKFILFFTNLVAVVISLAMIGVGSYSKATESSGADLSGFGTDPAALLIAGGCLVFVVAFCGMIGSLREHLLLLRIFNGMLLLLLILELGGGLSVYFLRDKVKQAAGVQVLGAIKKYQTSNVQTALDDSVTQVQISFQCCGAFQPTDWRDNSPYFKCDEKETFLTLYSSCSVPASCCRNGTSNNQCGYKVFSYPNMTKAEQDRYPRIGNREALIWTNGCVNAVYDWLTANWVTLVIICAVILVIEILGVECARRMIENLIIIKKIGYLKRH